MLLSCEQLFKNVSGRVVLQHCGRWWVGGGLYQDLPGVNPHWNGSFAHLIFETLSVYLLSGLFVFLTWMIGSEVTWRACPASICIYCWRALKKYDDKITGYQRNGREGDQNHEKVKQRNHKTHRHGHPSSELFSAWPLLSIGPTSIPIQRGSGVLSFGKAVCEFPRLKH